MWKPVGCLNFFLFCYLFKVLSFGFKPESASHYIIVVSMSTLDLYKQLTVQ